MTDKFFSKQFQRATKLSIPEAIEKDIEMLYDPDSNAFYNWDDIADWEEYKPETPLPEWMFGTSLIYIELQAGLIIEDACDELHEDAAESIPKENIKELQKFLDEWCSKQKNYTATYNTDYNVAIILEKEEVNKLFMPQR